MFTSQQQSLREVQYVNTHRHTCCDLRLLRPRGGVIAHLAHCSPSNTVVLVSQMASVLLKHFCISPVLHTQLRL